jgi:hypothetical protein
MENAVGMETALFGGPPELGNMLKLANGQIGFMTIFAHPLFANVADIIPAMKFAADEILTNKGVWFTRAEHEKKLQLVKKGTGAGDGGAVSPRTQSPAGRQKQLPSSPLAARGESPGGSSQRTRGSADVTPQRTSRPSSLSAVAAIAAPGIETSARQAGGSRTSDHLETSDRTRLGSVFVNGENIPMGLTLDGAQHDHQPESSTDRLATTAKEMSDESLQTHNDTRKDNAVSMRAGVADIPEGAMKDGPVSDAEALQKFKFATSNEDEPVRTFDPDKDYQPSHLGLRASAPSAQPDIKQSTAPNIPPNIPPKITEDESSTTKPRPSAAEEVLTPSDSATSYISDKSDSASRHQNSFQAVRNRAASAPMQSGGSFSLGSNSTTSREGSKYDVHTTTILSNGEVEGEAGKEGRERDRKASTKTMGRRRSKLKLGLAFWKRTRSSDKSVGEGSTGDRPESEGSGG